MKVGAIAYRKTPNGVEVCLVSSLRHKGTLTFPKGNVKEGETLTQAVKRELFEEAGLRGKIKNKKRPFCTQLSFGKREPVFYFLFKITEMVSVWPESKRRKRLFTTIKGMKELPLGHAPRRLRRELTSLKLPGHKKSGSMTTKVARKSASERAGDSIRPA